MDDIITINHGADAIVDLIGNFAKKKFKSANRYLHEILILKQLSWHPNIIRVITFEPNNLVINFPRYDCDLMMALLDGRCLHTKTCIATLYDALEYCHYSLLVHRDVKPENILISHDNQAILCDFARARFAPRSLKINFDGTLIYGAPEALKGICNLKNDIWSFAIVIFCLIEKQMPFDEDDKDRLPEFDDEMWLDVYSESVRKILYLMFDHNFETRANIDTCSELKRICT